jgi:hypothetical protein
MTETTKVALISSIITGAFSLLIAIIKGYHGEILSLLRLRKRRIEGTWIGQGIERPLGSIAAPFQETYDISIELQQIGSRIKGKGMGKSSSGEYYEAKLTGKMEDEHFVTLSAHATSPQEFDICVMLFELDARGEKLSGYSLANGLSQHGITLAEISLTNEHH